MEPPYQRIAGEIRRRIETGQLRPGDRVPSTRQIARDHGVAMATATRVLATLSQEGWIQAVPRVGAIVAVGLDSPVVPPAPPPVEPPAPRRTGGSTSDITRADVLRAAIEIADADGLSALSMRGVGSRLDVPTMSLYRYVRAKEELVLLMADEVFAELRPSYADSPEGWRPRLEYLARMLWQLCQRHPWLTQVIMLTRPLLTPNVITYADATMAALNELGLPPADLFDLHITLYCFVQGIASNLVWESQARADTNTTYDEWMATQETRLIEVTTSGEYPAFTRLVGGLPESYDLDLEVIFELGLSSFLDGVALRVERS